MKTLLACFAVLTGLGVMAFTYQNREIGRLKTAIEATTHERDAANAKPERIDPGEREPKTSAEGVSRGTPPAPPAQPVPATPERVEPVATPGVSITAPHGWFKNGSNPGGYVVGVDQLQTWGDMPSAYVKSNGASSNHFGGMMQMTAADDFIGKRLRLSAWVKTEDANDGGGHLWMRVDSHRPGESLQFDNMDNRAVKGTSDWQECSVVLDVPPGAAALAYGFFVGGRGKVWVSGTRLEQVSDEVASTNRVTPRVSTERTLSKAPVNLGFYPDQPR